MCKRSANLVLTVCLDCPKNECQSVLTVKKRKIMVSTPRVSMRTRWGVLGSSLSFLGSE